MNLAAIRIKCAELVGWTYIEQLAFTGIPKGSRGNADARVIPNYPQSAATALQLVEWMADKMGKHVQLTRTPNLRWIICVSNNGPVLHFAADSFAIVVCLAFLRANNIEPETL